MAECVPYNLSYSKFEEHDSSGATWYFSRSEIEENSPSRREGIDLKKEAYLRKSYCTFLQDLGMRLKVPQVTIATAIIFCHRFFLHQSHGKNDRRTIATVCMFLAGKVEETPRPLKDVIIVSYEIIHKKDPVAVQRIKQREVYEQQKELVLLGERVVLTTLGFDLNVHHPYKPLVEAIKKFKVAQNALAQVAWNFVNDGLRTSLCLQFKPHHIAAGAIFLAAKFLKVKLPSDGEKVWWQEFDVTPHQLEEVSNQMLELYEQNRAPASNGFETEGTSAGGSNYRGPVKSQASFDESSSQNRYSQALGTATAKQNNPTSSKPLADQSHTDKSNERMVKNEDHRGKEPRGGSWDHDADSGKDLWCHGSGNKPESLNNKANYVSEKPTEDHGQPKPGGKSEKKECNPGQGEGLKGYSSKDTIKKIDKDKVKAALEKRRKSRGDISRKVGFTNEDDSIERELESGVELAVEDEKAKQERKQSWSKNLDSQETVSSGYGTGNGNPVSNPNKESAEEGELPFATDYHSPENGSRKRKAPSPSRHIEGKERYDLPRHRSSAYLKHRGEDGRNIGRYDHMERDNKRYG